MLFFGGVIAIGTSSSSNGSEEDNPPPTVTGSHGSATDIGTASEESDPSDGTDAQVDPADASIQTVHSLVHEIAATGTGLG